MKTTLLVRDGLCQVVLHPESKAERAVLDLVSSGLSVDVHRGQFAETQAGYVRQFGLADRGDRGYATSYGDASLNAQPDLVLVLRPVEAKTADVELPPDKADLCKLRDGTWVYRNHAGTWQGCPPPFAPGEVPDDGHTYFRKMQDDNTWQVHTKVDVDGTRAWRPVTGVPGVDQRYDEADLMTEVARLRDALRDIRRESRDAVRMSEVPVSKAMVVDLCSALARAARRCDDALGGEKHDHVGGGHD